MNIQSKHSQAILELSGVNYEYNHKQRGLLEDINITVKKGQVVAVVGSSGCGKSTLLKIAAGIISPDFGSIYARNNINRGLSLQSPTLLPWLNVTENIAFKNKTSPKKISDGEIKELLECLDIAEKAYSKPNELSGGQQSRVAIARALAGNPELLLLDEPFSQLDEVTAEAILLKLSLMINKNKPATIFISHNITQAAFLADKIIVLGSNPAKIVGEVDIKLAQPRRHKSLASEEVRNAVIQVRKLLQETTK